MNLHYHFVPCASKEEKDKHKSSSTLKEFQLKVKWLRSVNKQLVGNTERQYICSFEKNCFARRRLRRSFGSATVLGQTSMSKVIDRGETKSFWQSSCFPFVQKRATYVNIALPSEIKYARHGLGSITSECRLIIVLPSCHIVSIFNEKGQKHTHKLLHKCFFLHM